MSLRHPRSRHYKLALFQSAVSKAELIMVSWQAWWPSSKCKIAPHSKLESELANLWPASSYAGWPSGSLLAAWLARLPARRLGEGSIKLLLSSLASHCLRNSSQELAENTPSSIVLCIRAGSDPAGPDPGRALGRAFVSLPPSGCVCVCEFASVGPLQMQPID